MGAVIGLSLFTSNALAAADITISSAQVVSSSTVLVTLDPHVEVLMVVDFSKWHIDATGGGVTPLDPISADVTSGASPGTITLTFSGTPFSATNTSFSAASGLYVDASGVTDAITDTNAVVGHAASIAITDGQAPAYVSSSTLDNDYNGTVDYIKVVYSEAVLDSSVDATDFEAGIDATAPTGLNESFTSLTPSSGLAIDAANDATIYIGVASNLETILANKTDYALKIQQIGAVTDSVPNSLASFAAQDSTDGANPRVKTSGGRITLDNDENGTVDYVKFIYTEALNDSTVLDTDFCISTSDSTCTGTDLVESFASTTPAANLANDDTIYVGVANGTQTITANKTDYTLATRMSGSVDDAVGNSSGSEGLAGNSTDGANPVVVSVSPTSGATRVAKTGTSLVITFSEDMDTTFAEATQFAISPNPTGVQTAIWSGSGIDNIATIALPTLLAGTPYSVTTDNSVINAAGGTPTALVTTGPSTGDWSFTTAANSSGGGGSSSVISHSVLVNSPNGGQSYNAGNTATITWTGSNVSSVNLSYATSATGTYTSITTNLPGTGTYNWTVPNISSTTVFVKAEGYDGATYLASDTSDTALTIIGTTVVTPPPTVPPENQPTTGTGVSPFTGLPEVINVVSAGDVIRGVHYATVYYIDANMNRRPFQDSQTFYTHYSSFYNVRTVTDATLSTLTMGKTMLPKAGAVLVKIVSDPRVYALETSYDGLHETVLRWVPSEAVAKTLYGNNWADYVIDIPSTLYTHFGTGTSMSSTDIIDRGAMLTRAYLNR